MPVVEVPCPNCGARLKAPDSMAGKKAMCKKCNKPFRIPGAPAGESIGDADIPVADFIDEGPSPPPPPAKSAAPAKPVTALPSADAFDFGKPAAKPAAAPPAPAKSTPATPGLPAAPRPAFGAAKAEPAPKPAAPPAPAKSTPATPTLPAKPAVTAAPSAPAAKPAEALSLDDETPRAKAKAPPASPPPPPPAAAAPAADPFAFSDEPAKPAKSKRRDDDEEDDRPAKSKKRRDEDEEDEAPRKKRRDDEDDRPAKSKKRDDDDEEEPRKKSKKRDDDDEEDEKPTKSKAKAPSDDGPYNPFANYSDDEDEPEPPKKFKKVWDDEDDDPKARKKRRDKDEDEKDPKGRKKRRDDDDDEEKEKPRYRRPEEKGGAFKTVLLTAIIGGVAAALGVAAVVVYIKNNRKPPEPEVKKEEKKDETYSITPPAGGDPKPKEKEPDPKPKEKEKEPDPKPKDKEPDPKPKDKEPDPKPKDPPLKKDPGPQRPTFALPKDRFSLGGLPAKPTPSDKPSREAGGVRTLEASLGSVKRVFPPFKPATADVCVLIQTSPPLMGKGEKLALDSYGPAGNRVPTARIEYDGDGDANPIADVYASPAGAHFLAATGGKLHVWSIADKKKIADGVDPYADKPEHAKAGLAAAFLTTTPNRVVTVSTAGAVHLYDVVNKKVISEFVPANAVPGRVTLGLSAAKSDENKSVVIAVAGVLYQLEASEGLKELRKYELPGDVVKSLGLAVSGTPGRILYAFEAVGGKAVLGLPLGAKASHILYKLPDNAGDPKGALWASETAGGVIIDRGVLWFDDHENKFLPLVLTQPPALGQYYGDERYFWYVVPNPAMAGKSFLVGLSIPFDDSTMYAEAFGGKQPIPAVRIDGTGLAK